MSDSNGLNPNTFVIFGLFSVVLFMTPMLKWIYVNVMREYAQLARHWHARFAQSLEKCNILW
jgi:hypothetical protein